MLSYELVCLVTKLPREQNKCEKKKQNLLILPNVGHLKVLIILPSTFHYFFFLLVSVSAFIFIDLLIFVKLYYLISQFVCSLFLIDGFISYALK
jgi:hypothetical protein